MKKRDAKGNLVKYTGDKTTATLGALNATITVDVSGGFGRVSFQLAGATGNMVITPEVTLDGTNWAACQIYSDKVGYLVSTIGAGEGAGIGIWRVACAGYASVRLRVTARTAGSYTVTAVRTEDKSASDSPISIGNLVPSSVNLQAVIGAVVPVLESSTPLASGATFTGGTKTGPADISFQNFTAIVSTDQSGTLKLQGYDGTTWFDTTIVAVAANVPATLAGDWITATMRAVYVNGGTNQGSFWLYTYCSAN